MNTEEGNKLIADFMNWEKCPRCEDEGCMRFPNSVISYKPLEMEFHTKWDWLMPVVDKINDNNSYHEINIDRTMVFLYTLRQDKVQIFYNEECGGKISAVYKAVIAFIEWYNKNKNGKQ